MTNKKFLQEAIQSGDADAIKALVEFAKLAEITDTIVIVTFMLVAGALGAHGLYFLFRGDEQKDDTT